MYHLAVLSQVTNWLQLASKRTKICCFFRFSTKLFIGNGVTITLTMNSIAHPRRSDQDMDLADVLRLTTGARSLVIYVLL